jgi:hypothetical protein
MNLEPGSFENRIQEKCLIYTLVVTGCARDTEAISEYIFFQGRIHTSNTSVDSSNCEIIEIILIVSDYLQNYFSTT